MVTEIVAAVCIAWYIFIVCVCSIGYGCLFLFYHQVPAKSTVVTSKAEDEIPNVTVVCPCKGIEPYLYECLASTFQQDYSRSKIKIHFCVSSREDPAYPIIARVVADHANHNARIFVQEEDDGIANGDEEESDYRKLLGPNPKIRNMSKAYREAGKNDLIWIVDCNVWVGRGVCGRMVDSLCGFTRHGESNRPYKLVHHLPISVDVSNDTALTDIAMYEKEKQSGTRSRTLRQGGGRLEELFLSSSHAKMYVAINTVAVAPCIVGKSTMFRRPHLDYLTSQKSQVFDSKNPTPSSEASTGIDFFSHNICEDHLIGDLLWKSPVPALPEFPREMRNHGLVYGDLAIQPVASMSVGSYISRRVRWLRVRKFTVPVATLVEPGTESFLCSAMGAYGLTTLEYTKAWAGETWQAFAFWWTLSILGWMAVDWTVFLLLHSGRTVEVDMQDQVAPVPRFARPLTNTLKARRKFSSWLLAWLGREALALPIWTWAIWGGSTVTWRDGKYWVDLDMRVHEIKEKYEGNPENGHVNGMTNGIMSKEKTR